MPWTPWTLASIFQNRHQRALLSQQSPCSGYDVQLISKLQNQHDSHSAPRLISGFDDAEISPLDLVFPPPAEAEADPLARLPSQARGMPAASADLSRRFLSGWLSPL
jgi:hypothetical protein